jgi:predicted nucleotidyltransferase
MVAGLYAVAEEACDKRSKKCYGLSHAVENQTGSAMKTASEVLSHEAAARLSEYRRAARDALPGLERMILFGSRARGEAREDSDYDIAVVVRDLPDRRHVRRILSDLAYEHILSGFFIRPVPLPQGYLDRGNERPTELADEIARDGVEVE